jgi:hypothetical protein
MGPFPQYNWTKFYGNVEEAIPVDMPEPLGKDLDICMMGIPLTEPSYIFTDNKSQVTSLTIPESTLKKKCNSICYHAVQESVAMGESLITHINSDDNLSDLMTKVTCSSKCR